MTRSAEHYDVAIVGGGPAGLSAALWLARYLHSVVLVDSGDPRNWQTRGINGFLGSPGVRPSELRGAARNECRRYGVRLVDAMVERVRKRAEDEFVLRTDAGRQLIARRLLLAIGIKDVWPRTAGLEPCFGATIHVCPDCDGFEARGRKIVVIGRGRRAAGLALDLTTWSDQIIICSDGPDPDLDEPILGKLDALNIPVVTARIARVHAVGGRVTALDFAGGMVLDCERIFFSIAQYPGDDLGVQLGCRRDERGQIVIDPAYHTSVRNVFAAGDIVPGPQLAIAAASDGAIAAIAIHRSLVPDGRKLD
jgi:thioredoxin reductase